MEGEIKVSYTIICQNDVNQQLSLTEILKNEKIERAIKTEYAKGLRNLVLSAPSETEIYLKTKKVIYDFVVSKDDFADILVLAEEDARKHKRIKKECDGVELVDIVTLTE